VLFLSILLFGPCGVHPSVLARTFDKPSRAGAVKVAHFARPRGLDLDGSEHDGRIECAGGSRKLPVPPLELDR
jgi:hypothetical protein